MNKTIKVFAILFWVIGAGLYITSMLTDYWIKGSLDTRYGLFKLCIVDCMEFGWEIDTDNETFLQIFLPRILMLIGAGMIVIGALIGLVGVCTKQEYFWIAEGTFEVLGGLIVLAACAIFTAFNFDDKSILVVDEFHFSFYLAWVSGGMYVVSGICSIVSAKNFSF